jgi:phosphate transport system protein
LNQQPDTGGPVPHPGAPRHFHSELSDLKSKLLTMSAEAQLALGTALDAVLKRDGTRARRVIGGDGAIDALELEIEELVLRLLATQQPMARDLRLLVAAAKIANDLERVGDHAVNIAQSAERLLAYREVTPEPELVEMARQARAMLSGALDAFVRGDSALGRDICRRDDAVDALNRSIFRILLTHMMEDPRSIGAGMELFLVSRNLERVADLATNIAEDVVFLVEGRTIKHHAEEVQPPPGAAPGTRGSRTA